MTSKLSFRARALDATKSLPIYRDTEIPESADCSAINRTVPQMPTGMEKEEESEHHLQRAICTGTTIPTPEVYAIDDLSFYNLMYPADYKTPRQLIYMQPFSMEADIPDYDMDSEDEMWINGQSIKLELTADKFEEMMDRLEKGSGQTVVTLQEAKALIKEDDDLIIAVYDYWLTKRLKTQHHLIPQVRTEARLGISNHNPYIAFRRRTEKMQTRKNRKNDESSYEKMLKLKRDLCRAVTLLEMVKRREKSKRELLHLSIEVFEKRFQAGDFSGQILNEALSQRPTRPAFTPLYQANQIPWIKDGGNVLASLAKKEKRHYKKRRHKSSSKTPSVTALGSGIEPTTSSQSLEFAEGDPSSDEEVFTPPSEEEEEEEGEYPFRRRLNCLYHVASDSVRSPPGCSNVEEGKGDKCSFFPASTSLYGQNRFIGSVRRRLGRGGRMVIDRSMRGSDDFWKTLGYEVYDSGRTDSNQLSNDGFLVGHSPVHEPSIPAISDLVGKPLPEHLRFKKITRNRVTGTYSSSLESLAVAGTSKSRSRIKPFEESSDDETELRMPELKPFMGAIGSNVDEPLLFDMENLLEETTGDQHVETEEPFYFIRGNLDELPIETALLDKTSADLCNTQVLSKPEELKETDSTNPSSWFDMSDYSLGLTLPFDYDLMDTTSSPDSNSSQEENHDQTQIKVEVESTNEEDPEDLVSTIIQPTNSETQEEGPSSTLSLNVVVSPEVLVNHNHVVSPEVLVNHNHNHNNHHHSEPMEIEETSTSSSSSTNVVNVPYSLIKTKPNWAGEAVVLENGFSKIL